MKTKIYSFFVIIVVLLASCGDQTMDEFPVLTTWYIIDTTIVDALIYPTENRVYNQSILPAMEPSIDLDGDGIKDMTMQYSSSPGNGGIVIYSGLSAIDSNLTFLGAERLDSLVSYVTGETVYTQNYDFKEIYQTYGLCHFILIRFWKVKI